MGSDSDLAVMREAVNILNEFNVPHELDIVSAHRTTAKMTTYARTAKQRGIQVIIAGAGGAAHLPGMIASLTPIPVVGVPIKTRSLEGLDSLLSIAQMPPGVPVASMAINGAKNAGIFACQILAIKHRELARKIEMYKYELKRDVLKKGRVLKKAGPSGYLKMMEPKS